MAAEHLWKTFSLIPKKHLVWFHVVMTENFRNDLMENFKEGLGDDEEANGLCGFMCTDPVEMVCNYS